MDKPEPIYIGDDAYVNISPADSLVITAGHHDPSHIDCDAVVYIDPSSIPALKAYIAAYELYTA